MMPIDSTTLAYFLRVVELGSINRAAENLGISQPTLSRALQYLEGALGQQLLIRTPQGVTVTPSGELMVERCKPILAQIEMLQVDVATSGAGRLSIGLPTSFSQVVTTPLAVRLLTRWPTLKLRLYDGIINHLRLWMEQGLLDFGVMMSLEPVPAHFESTPLVSEPLLLVGPSLVGPSLGEKPHGPVRLESLGERPMILPGHPNTIRALVENTMIRRNMTYSCAAEAETLGACLNLARAGLGWTIMPRSALVRVDLGGLESSAIEGLNLTWDLCVNSSRRHSRLLTQAVQELTSVVRDAVRTGDWPDARMSGAEAPRPPGPAPSVVSTE
jgi:LysR family nitrogen assimilation transcriptional regulator